MGVFVDNLPVQLVSDGFLRRLVNLFEDVQEGVSIHADALEVVCDLATTSPEMVRFLGQWLGMDDVDPSLDPRRQRRLVEVWGATMTRRGTSAALAALLDAVTDATGTVIEESGRVLAPGEPAQPVRPWAKITLQGTGNLTYRQLISLVRRELPIHVLFELWVGDLMVWRDASDGEPGTSLIAEVAAAS